MGFFIDILPIAGFLVAFFVWDIYVATWVLMALAVTQVSAHFLIKRRVEKLHLFNLGLSLVLGGFTLWLHDENFIKWKPSVFLWLIGAIILGRQWTSGTLTIRSLVEKLMQLDHPVEEGVWRRLNSVWGWAMLGAGVLNIVVAYSLPLEVWVIFKFAHILALNLALAVYTSVVLKPPGTKGEA